MSGFRGFLAKLGGKMGLDALTRIFFKFLRAHGLFFFGFNLSNIFISTFLFEANGTLAIVAKYYLVVYSVEILCAFFAAHIIRRAPMRILSQIGLFAYMASFALLILSRENAETIYPLIALASGVGAAFYWVPYHSYTMDYTTAETRQLGYSLVEMLNNFIVLITPPLSGFVIAALPGISGYMAVFAAALVAAGCSYVITRKLPSEPLRVDKNPLFQVFRERWRDKIAWCFGASEFFRGVREGVFLYYLNVLLFSMTSDTFVTGLAAAGKSVAVILTFNFLRRVTSPRRRANLMTAGVVCCILFAASLSFWYTAAAVICFIIADAVFQATVYNQAQLVMYSVDDYFALGGQPRGYRTVAFRNTFICLGHLAGIVIYLLIPPGEAFIVPMLVLLSALLIPYCILNRTAQRLCKKALDAPAEAEKIHETV